MAAGIIGAWTALKAVGFGADSHIDKAERFDALMQNSVRVPVRIRELWRSIGADRHDEPGRIFVLSEPDHLVVPNRGSVPP